METAKVIEEWSVHVSDYDLAQMGVHWLIRAELARTVGERQKCQKMMNMYFDEIARRQDNGRSGKGD